MTARDPLLAPPKRNRRSEPLHRRTFGKARRRSVIAGYERWEPLSWKEVGYRRRALRIYIPSTWKPGKKHGAAGEASLDVLGDGHARLYDKLLDFAASCGGRVEPSLSWLAEQLGHTVRTIHRWLKALRAHGWLRWDRRYVETDGQHARGPQVEQTSNAYYLQLPMQALARLGWKRKPPEPALPDDEAARRHAKAEEFRAMQDEADRDFMASGGNPFRAIAKDLRADRQADPASPGGNVVALRGEKPAGH